MFPQLYLTEIRGNVHKFQFNCPKRDGEGDARSHLELANPLLIMLVLIGPFHHPPSPSPPPLSSNIQCTICLSEGVAVVEKHIKTQTHCLFGV